MLTTNSMLSHLIHFPYQCSQDSTSIKQKIISLCTYY
uniref:Uncharacterized protein n=1 Tax=Rhizophora mucronata TaxID=61149 RepID=A0A2P2NJP6_RHIMU